MNKKLSQGVVVGAFALFLTLMVGYALFSQNLNITGTAKAQGDFKIEAVCTPGAGIFETELGADDTDSGYANDSCTVAGNTVSMKTELKFPTAHRNFMVEMKNTGSIDAVLAVDEDVAGEVGIEEDSIDCLDGYNGATKDGAISEDECSTTLRLGGGYRVFEYLKIKDKSGNYFDLINDDNAYAKYINDETGYLTLPAGESIITLFDFSFNPRDQLEQKDFLVELRKNYKFHFKQTS